MILIAFLKKSLQSSDTLNTTSCQFECRYDNDDGIVTQRPPWGRVLSDLPIKHYRQNKVESELKKNKTEYPSVLRCPESEGTLRYPKEP